MSEAYQCDRCDALFSGESVGTLVLTTEEPFRFWEGTFRGERYDDLCGSCTRELAAAVFKYEDRESDE